MEKQIGTTKGHRVVIQRDMKDGKAISYEVAEYLSPSDFEKLQLEVKLKQEELVKEQEMLNIKLEAEERERSKKLDEEAKIKAYNNLYSFDHFAVCHSIIQNKIFLGAIEDDGSFSLLLDSVLNEELTVEEAVDSHEEMAKLFYKFYGNIEGGKD